LRYLVIAAIILYWELAPRLEWVSPVMLASFTQTFQAGISDFANFAHHLGVTVNELLLALSISFFGGAVTGLILGGIRPLRETLLPIVSSIYAVPLVIVYPIFTAWVGIGSESKVLFGGIYGFFPMLLATAAGVQTVDTKLLVAARSMGANRKQLILEVMLPAAIPSVLSGLRLGAAMTAIGVVVAEMMAATAGIGYLITQNRTMFNTPEVYFGVLLVLILAGLLDWVIRLVERRAASWYPQKETAI
jgi:NitT/TauT family transport system permease protein/taurine transport system permease protein